jgi:transcription termination/antitermination protein NusG
VQETELRRTGPQDADQPETGREPSDQRTSGEHVSDEQVSDDEQVSEDEPADDEPADDEPADDEELSDDQESSDEDVQPIEELATGDEEIRKEWYILKVQSNRESSICEGLKRRVARAGLDEYFDEVIVPTEDVAEFKNGKRRVVKRKLYPGYIVVHMAITDETWFLVRETPGIGDFTGSAGHPTPMLPHEVERIVRKSSAQEEGGEPIKTAIPFKQGDRVRIKEGTFENFEGDVEGIDEANGRVTVMINIFGRSTPVELEHWQIDAV